MKVKKKNKDSPL